MEFASLEGLVRGMVQRLPESQIERMREVIAKLPDVGGCGCQNRKQLLDTWMTKEPPRG